MLVDAGCSIDVRHLSIVCHVEMGSCAYFVCLDMRSKPNIQLLCCLEHELAVPPDDSHVENCGRCLYVFDIFANEL